jgi:hypothetical protein
VERLPYVIYVFLAFTWITGATEYHFSQWHSDPFISTNFQTNSVSNYFFQADENQTQAALLSSDSANSSVIKPIDSDQHCTECTDELESFASNPVRVFSDLHTFKIIDSDESSDEPYLINIMILIDGATVDVYNLPNATIRLHANQNTHGNIPQYKGNLTSGENVEIPDATGFLSATMKPLSSALLNTAFHGHHITNTHLDAAASMLLISIALEEDAVSTTAAETMRNALIQQLKQYLTEKIQALEPSDLVPLLTGGTESFNLLSLITRPYEQQCASFEAQNIDTSTMPMCLPGWFQIQTSIVDYAISMGKAAEQAHWNLFQILASALDPDDFIGIDFAFFNLDQLRHATQPLPFELNFSKISNTSHSTSPSYVRYKILGEVGRCSEQQGTATCTPYYADRLHHHGQEDPVLALD